MRWIESASTVVEMAVRVLLLVILMVVGTVLVVGFLRLGRADRKSITIASFTESATDTREDKSRGLGHDLADSLEFEILRIGQLHTLTNPWGSPQELPSLQMTGVQTVERVGGTISLAGVELPVEVVVEVLKPLLARPRTQYVITGKFQRLTSNDGTGMNASSRTAEKDDCLMVPLGDGIPVQLIVRLEADGRMRKRWTCLSLLTSAADRDADTPSALGLHLARHLRKIAYEIMWIVLEGVEANSFENFKAFIEGVETFRKYKDLVRLSSTTKDEGKKLSRQEELKMQEVFGKAEALLKQAIEKNRAYARAHFYLGNLYSWRAHDEEDESSGNMYEERAKDMYRRTATGTTAKPHEAGALSDFGLGLVDYRHYRKAKKQNRHLSYVHLLDSALQSFRASSEQDSDFYLARTGNALIYTEKSEQVEQPEKRKEREFYLNRAIAELRHSRAIAVNLKDADSVKWLDKRILELESKKRQRNETQDDQRLLTKR